MLEYSNLGEISVVIRIVSHNRLKLGAYVTKRVCKQTSALHTCRPNFILHRGMQCADCTVHTTDWL